MSERSATVQAKLASSDESSIGGVLQRKCACGNSTMASGECAECGKNKLQRKLSVGATDDPLELEADRIADRVLQAPVAPGGLVQRRLSGAESGVTEAPPIVKEVLRSPGQALDASTRTFFEPRFGQDFSQVRVHTDAKAQESARAVDSLAYTVGRDVVIGGPQATAMGGNHELLAHELTHVVQQNSLSPVQHFPLLQRQPNKKKQPQTGGTKKQTPAASFTVGEVEFSKDAAADLLKHGSILPGPDNTHVAIITPGNKLGYDPGHTDPADPFRWEKIKFIVDTKEKVLIRKFSLGDKVKVRMINAGVTKDLDHVLLDPGLTLVTETLHNKIYPASTGLIVVSPSADTHHIYYSVDLSDPASSGLAHEVLGHLWLALKGVPFVHPKKPADIKATGTLEAKHGITDPFGNVYTGTVRDFIRDFVGSESLSRLKSPTQGVGAAPYGRALSQFTKDFPKEASGKLNGSWKVSGGIDGLWEILSTNYEMAQSISSSTTAPSGPSPANPAAIEQDIESFYNGLSVDRQYVFLRYLEKIRTDLLRRIALANKMAKTLTPPPGMK